MKKILVLLVVLVFCVGCFEKSKEKSEKKQRIIILERECAWGACYSVYKDILTEKCYLLFDSGTQTTEYIACQ